MKMTAWAVLAGLLMCQPLWADEQSQLLFGHDDRQAVSVTRTPWQAIAQIETAGENLCSGVLIAPQWVLSAGHCFVDAHHGQDPAINVQFAGARSQFYRPDHLYFPRELINGLKGNGDGFVISAEASPHDVALIHLTKPVAHIAPLPLWRGSSEQLAALLKQDKVSQAGYPADHLDTLLAHQGCQVDKVNADGTLAHRCDTLPGDSGSPLLLEEGGVWWVVGVQSSAPDASERQEADNLAVAVPSVARQLQRWMGG